MLAAALSGCATRAPLAADALSGRIAVRVDGQPDRSVSASFELIGTTSHGRLVLTGPLGTTAAQAEWADGQAWLVANGERTRFNGLDELAEAALGERIPIAALFDWLRGQPWPGAAHQTRTDGTAGFEQLGWRIDLTRWADGALDAVRDSVPAVTLRARLERP
jgi:outer membrane lipoprotein LolB